MVHYFSGPIGNILKLSGAIAHPDHPFPWITPLSVMPHWRSFGYRSSRRPYSRSFLEWTVRYKSSPNEPIGSNVNDNRLSESESAIFAFTKQMATLATSQSHDRASRTSQDSRSHSSRSCSGSRVFTITELLLLLLSRVNRNSQYKVPALAISVVTQSQT